MKVMILTMVAVVCVAMCSPHTAAADVPDAAQAAIDAFDIDRAFISEKQMFVPFHVEATEPLSDALAAGRVNNEMPLLILERPGGVVSLLLQQMAYHHVAQGQFDGEPWMASY